MEKQSQPEFYLSQMGLLTGFRFIPAGGQARIELGGPDLIRLLPLLERYTLRYHQQPPPEVLAALDTLSAFLDKNRRDPHLTVLLDIWIGDEGADLRPMPLDDPKSGPDTPPASFPEAAADE